MLHALKTFKFPNFSIFEILIKLTDLKMPNVLLKHLE